MFAQPKPILPGVEDEELSKAGEEKSPIKTAGEIVGSEEAGQGPAATAIKTPDSTGNVVTSTPGVTGVQVAAIPKIETAWERGLRQAKEMKRRSQQRKVFMCINLTVFMHRLDNYLGVP